jgi:hypothetical protein
MTLTQIINNAFQDVSESGWTPESIARWASVFRDGAGGYFKTSPDHAVRPAIERFYKKQMAKGAFYERHEGISKLTVEQIEPEFRQLLDNAIRNSINLIKLERDNGSIEVSTRRFSAWLSGVKQGQEAMPDKTLILAPLSKQLKYEISRRGIDQGMKVMANIDSVIAQQGGAIACIWHSHAKTPAYQARPEHWARNNKLYIIRDSWAVEQGLLKKQNDFWVEEIPDPPSVPVFCSCFFEYVYSLERLYQLHPESFTKKGIEEIKR